jgi:hypothetical protein
MAWEIGVSVDVPLIPDAKARTAAYSSDTIRPGAKVSTSRTSFTCSSRNWEHLLGTTRHSSARARPPWGANHRRLLPPRQQSRDLSIRFAISSGH